MLWRQIKEAEKMKREHGTEGEGRRKDCFQGRIYDLTAIGHSTSFRRYFAPSPFSYLYTPQQLLFTLPSSDVA